MKTQRLGTTDLEVSVLAYGCMRLANVMRREHLTPDRIQNGIAVLEAAVEAGYTFFDHANIYGDTTCELIFGQALEKHPDWRERLVVTTKCGIRFPNQPNPGDPQRYDFTPSHLKEEVEGSLQRLQLERLDLLQLHRPDYLANYVAVAQTLIELRKEGKVRYFGVSNFRPDLVALLQQHLPEDKLQVNQLEISLSRHQCLDDGCLDECQAHQRTPLAWSPLGGGKLGTGYRPDTRSERYVQDTLLLQTLDAVAHELEAGRSETALAWLRRHPTGIIPIIGTTSISRLRAAVEAADLELSHSQWYRLLEAAMGHRVP